MNCWNWQTRRTQNPEYHAFSERNLQTESDRNRLLWPIFGGLLGADMTVDDSDDCAMDVPILPMPERCIQWPCVSFGAAAKLRPVEHYGHTYMCCPFCNGSYGEVKP